MNDLEEALKIAMPCRSCINHENGYFILNTNGEQVLSNQSKFQRFLRGEYIPHAITEEQVIYNKRLEAARESRIGLAGIHLQKSANAQWTAIGLEAAAGVFAGIGAICESSSGSKGFFAVAGLCGIGSIVATCISIGEKKKSSKELILAPTSVTLRF